MHRFMVQAFQDPPFCSITVLDVFSLCTPLSLFIFFAYLSFFMLFPVFFSVLQIDINSLLSQRFSLLRPSYYPYALLQHIFGDLFAPFFTTTLQTTFHLCIPKKALAKISTKYFHNRIIMFCLELWNSVDKYSCHYREQHISTLNYEITVVQGIHISRLELQGWSLEMVISLSKVYFWDLGLRFG